MTIADRPRSPFVAIALAACLMAMALLGGCLGERDIVDARSTSCEEDDGPVAVLHVRNPSGAPASHVDVKRIAGELLYGYFDVVEGNPGITLPTDANGCVTFPFDGPGKYTFFVLPTGCMNLARVDLEWDGVGGEMLAVQRNCTPPFGAEHACRNVADWARSDEAYLFVQAGERSYMDRESQMQPFPEAAITLTHEPTSGVRSEVVKVADAMGCAHFAWQGHGSYAVAAAYNDCHGVATQFTWNSPLDPDHASLAVFPECAPLPLPPSGSAPARCDPTDPSVLALAFEEMYSWAPLADVEVRVAYHGLKTSDGVHRSTTRTDLRGCAVLGAHEGHYRWSVDRDGCNLEQVTWTASPADDGIPGRETYPVSCNPVTSNQPWEAGPPWCADADRSVLAIRFVGLDGLPMWLEALVRYAPLDGTSPGSWTIRGDENACAVVGTQPGRYELYPHYSNCKLPTRASFFWDGRSGDTWPLVEQVVCDGYPGH